MARTVTDVAILLGAVAVPVRRGRSATRPHRLHAVPRHRPRRRAIGIDQRYLTYAYAFPVNPDTLEAFNAGLDALESLGATLVPCDTGDIFAYGGDEFTALASNSRRISRSISPAWPHLDADTVRSDRVQQCPLRGRDAVLRPGALRDLERHPAILPILSTSPRAPTAWRCRERRGSMGCSYSGVDAIVAPSYTLATQPAAVAGYPNVAIPCGFTGNGRPAGLWMYAGFLDEPKLLAYAYALEQALQPRVQPTYGDRCSRSHQVRASVRKWRSPRKWMTGFRALQAGRCSAGCDRRASCLL